MLIILLKICWYCFCFGTLKIQITKNAQEKHLVFTTDSTVGGM